MSNAESFDPFFIGWDVGAWYCNQNNASRDAVVILNSQLELVGNIWRGSLFDPIVQSVDSRDFIRSLFNLSSAGNPPMQVPFFLAIDAPLGFSNEFVALVSNFKTAQPGESFAKNSYMFRQTERFLYEQGQKPLSAINHMIGSQATKAIHTLARFAPLTQRCGVWGDGERLSVIEAYPAACKNSKIIKDQLQQCQIPSGWRNDEKDALVCALIAGLFSQQPDSLFPPPAGIPVGEGWIWVPKDISQGGSS